jgi:hypothetical protein
MIKRIFTASSFIIRHFIASVVSIVAPIILISITYFVLFIIAIFTNTSLGSPVALPLSIIFCLVVSITYTTFFLSPSVLLAEIVSRIFKKWQHVAQIPVSVLMLVGLIWLISFLLRSLSVYQNNPILHWADYPQYTLLALLIPLGIYWWIMKIVQICVAAPIAIFTRLKHARKPAVVKSAPETYNLTEDKYI